MVRQATKVGGITGIALTKLDVLDGMAQLKVCTGYELNGEKLDFFFIDLKIKDNFDLADFFYDIHIIGNYILIFLVLLHIIAVFIHRLLFKENLLKKIL